MHEEKLLEHFLKVRKVCTDTRQLEQGDLFFALKGANFDGNQYAASALESGASLAVVDDPQVASDNRYLLVDDVLKSLQNLARNYRRRHQATFIGITGSNGKTTTKELLRDVLAKKYKTQATAGNFNNHIGVPLTLLSISHDTEMAIIEMGANHQGEIAELSAIAEPDFGMITNIGKAHLEGFGGILGVKKGKGELFRFLESTDRTAFVNTDLQHLPEIAPPRKINYSESTLAIEALNEPRTLCFTWKHGGKEFQVNSQLTGRYNLANFMAAIAIGLHFNVDPDDITDALTNYVPDNQRSQLKETPLNTLILDAYNANPSSTSAALDNLAGMEGHRFFILGDMFELGDDAEKDHQAIADQARALELDGFLVGENFSRVNSELETFVSTEEVFNHLSKHKLEGKTILIKGSRGMKLERLIDLL